MMKLMTQMLTNRQLAQPSPTPVNTTSTKSNDTELDDDSWEKKLNMSQNSLDSVDWLEERKASSHNCGSS